jgi:hypothetical protein
VVSLLPSFNPQGTSIAEHPLYKIEYKQVRWAATLPRFRAVSIRTIIVSALFMIGVWAFFSWLIARNVSYYYSYWGSEIFLVLLGLTFVVGVVLDFMCMSSSSDAINSDIANGRWDLLRLTALNEQGILSAKHAISQLRCWRTVMVMFGLRLGVSIIALILIIVPTFRAAYFGSDMVITLIILGLMMTVYVLEPFWRARALTAMGIYVSSLNRSTSGTFLTAFFALFVVWLLQSAVIGAAMFGVTWIAIGLASTSSGYAASFFFGLCFNGVWLAILCSAIYGFYHLLEQWSLRRTLKRIARSAA